MACSNCFNGCADIISDKCVKYTGIDIPALGILTGDTLLTVENKITEKLQEVMTGEGIIPTIDPVDVCDLITGFLPCCPPQNLNDYLTAIIKSICDIEERLLLAEEALETLNADYVLPIDCLSGVTADSDTHDIVQAVITKLCQVSSDLTSLIASLDTTYVRKDEIQGIVEEIITSSPITELISSKMVPFTILPFYGDRTGKFDGTGAGIGAWVNIYLCNGSHGTPDLRGRTLVGTTTMGGPVVMDAEVLPGVPPGSPVGTPPNPTYPEYPSNVKFGSNRAPLGASNLPSHNHNVAGTNSATVTINDPGHMHTFMGSTLNDGESGPFIITAAQSQDVFRNIGTGYPAVKTATDLKGTVAGVGQNVFVNTENVGGGISHANIQPVYSMDYIIYIPA